MLDGTMEQQPNQNPTFVLDIEAILSEADIKSIQAGMQMSYDLGRRAAAADILQLKTTKAKTIKLQDAVDAAKGIVK